MVFISLGKKELPIDAPFTPYQVVPGDNKEHIHESRIYPEEVPFMRRCLQD
jgi:hypothetical protein